MDLFRPCWACVGFCCLSGTELKFLSFRRISSLCVLQMHLLLLRYRVALHLLEPSDRFFFLLLYIRHIACPFQQLFLDLLIWTFFYTHDSWWGWMSWTMASILKPRRALGGSLFLSSTSELPLDGKSLLALMHPCLVCSTDASLTCRDSVLHAFQFSLLVFLAILSQLNQTPLLLAPLGELTVCGKVKHPLFAQPMETQDPTD